LNYHVIYVFVMKLALYFALRLMIMKWLLLCRDLNEGEKTWKETEERKRD